jgi:hypothetical protein
MTPDGARIDLIGLIHVLIQVLLVLAFLGGCSQTSQHDEGFIHKLHRIGDREKREQYVQNHIGEPITLSGTVKEIFPGGFVGRPFFYLDVYPNALEETVDVAVQFDYKRIRRITIDTDYKAAMCTYTDGTRFVLASGQHVTVSGEIAGFRADWFNTKGLLTRGNASMAINQARQ